MGLLEALEPGEERARTEELAPARLALELVAAKLGDRSARSRALTARAADAGHPVWRALLQIDATTLLATADDTTPEELDAALATLENGAGDGGAGDLRRRPRSRAGGQSRGAGRERPHRFRGASRPRPCLRDGARRASRADLRIHLGDGPYRRGAATAAIAAACRVPTGHRRTWSTHGFVPPMRTRARETRRRRQLVSIARSRWWPRPGRIPPNRWSRRCCGRASVSPIARAICRRPPSWPSSGCTTRKIPSWRRRWPRGWRRRRWSRATWLARKTR